MLTISFLATFYYFFFKWGSHKNWDEIQSLERKSTADEPSFAIFSCGDFWLRTFSFLFLVYFTVSISEKWRRRSGKERRVGSPAPTPPPPQQQQQHGQRERRPKAQQKGNDDNKTRNGDKENGDWWWRRRRRRPVKRARPSPTTSCRRWRRVSSARNTSVSRIDWNWRPSSASPTPKSRLGTRTEGTIQNRFKRIDYFRSQFSVLGSCWLPLGRHSFFWVFFFSKRLFYWVLMGFTRFLPGFYWVLLRVT